MEDKNIDARVTILENTVVTQNEATRATLVAMQRVLGEIHDKMDTYILEQAVQRTKDRKDIESNTEDIDDVRSHSEKGFEKTDKKITTMFGFLLTAITFLGGGIWMTLKEVKTSPPPPAKIHAVTPANNSK